MTTTPTQHNPLSLIGKLEARYYALRLTGLVPLRPEHIPRSGHSTLATFSLQSERAHPHSNYDASLRLPHHPRNALLLHALNAAFDACHSSKTGLAHPHLPPRQHDAPAHERTGRPVLAPTMPYPMPADSLEFFPLSSLRLAYNQPHEQRINLTDWFVAECLAGAHTYTQLMDTTTRTALNSKARYHTYEQTLTNDFYYGGKGHIALMSYVLFPPTAERPASTLYTPETADLTLHDIIDSPDNLPTPLPPRREWFNLHATPRTPTHADVGVIGAMRPEDPVNSTPAYPYTHYAAWVDYTLSNPATPGRANERRFSAPYFSPADYTGWSYKYLHQVAHLDEKLISLTPADVMPGGFDMAHDTTTTTPAALMQEARDYAITLSNQRASRLAHLAEQYPATVVYSDLRCFTTAGRHDLTRMSTSFALLTRVNLPTHDNTAQPHECVADEQQYVRLHQLMSTHVRDDRLVDVADARTRDTIDVQNNPDLADLNRKEQLERIVALTQGNGGLVRTNPTTGIRRGRPKGARAVMTHERFIKAVKELALQADNALRPQPTHTRLHPEDIHNPTDSWTRLTPLMPPAPSEDLAQARYGRGLPIRAVNNQHIDSLLWRSLLNRWLNHPTMRETEALRPPVVQITALAPDIMDRMKGQTNVEAVEYTAGTHLALATVYIPIPASVMHRWLLEGPTNSEVSRVLPKTVPVTSGTFGRYLDPQINPITQHHERTPFFPEAMLVKGRESVPANTVPNIKCLPNPNRSTSWLMTPASIPWEVNLSPMVPTPRTE